MEQKLTDKEIMLQLADDLEKFKMPEVEGSTAKTVVRTAKEMIAQAYRYIRLNKKLY